MKFGYNKSLKERDALKRALSSNVMCKKDKQMKFITMLLFLLPTISFANTSTYVCNYSSYSDQEGNHKVKKKFELNFIVDKKADKSYMLGNNGSTEIKLIKSSDQLAFIEITATGNIMSTSIDSKLNSVHSRNSVMFGEMLPSQYYGICEVK